MLFGFWWGFWVIGAAMVFCLLRSICCMWMGTRPVSGESK